MILQTYHFRNFHFSNKKISYSKWRQLHQGQITLHLVYTYWKKKKTSTIIILIMANHFLDLLIACCNRDQTSDIHGTFQVFVAMASWQNVEACILVPIIMYRTITHSLGLSWSLSLDSLLVTHSWLHSEKSRIDWHFLPQVWVAINIQTRRWLVDLFIMYTSHPPTMIDFHRRKKKNMKKI